MCLSLCPLYALYIFFKLEIVTNLTSNLIVTNQKNKKVMGVALNGKDDLRMLRGAVIIGFAGAAFLFAVARFVGQVVCSRQVLCGGKCVIGLNFNEFL